ncbi:MAG TPA: rod shape-determining protein MreC [bacterium]|nr:rod shape-determining protein MreC [bacterium]
MLKRNLFILSFALLAAAAFFLPGAVSEWFWRISYVRDARIAVDTELDRIARTLSILGDLRQVGERNIALEEENARLRLQLIMNDGIKRENEELSKLLKIKDTYSRYAIIPARILSYSAVNPNRITIHYDEQYAKHLAQNAPAVSSMGLVGLVKSFGRNHAEVELITSRNFSLPAVLESREECTAILRGNGQTLSIQFLEKVCNTPPATGMKMLSANLSENYSLPYIPIGIIGALTDDETNILFYKGEALPLFKKGKLNHLFIIAGGSFVDEKLFP